MPDSGTLTVRDDSKFRASRKVAVDWQCGSGVATFEKTLALTLRGEVRAIAHKPGATAPTDNSDLDVYLEEDTSMDGPVVVSTGDGANLIRTVFTHKPLTTPFIVHGKLRFLITGNIVNDANGTLYLTMRNAEGPWP